LKHTVLFLDAAFAPGRPRVVESDGANVVLRWDPPVAYEANYNIVGYHVEYRVVGALDWITATNYLVRDTTCTGKYIDKTVFD